MWGSKYDYAQFEYVNATTKGIVICPKPRHGAWKVTPSNHCWQHSGCPICSESDGERAVRLVLESLKTPFKTQYRIPECKNKRALPFDFAVWINDKLYLIEFQGKQHYEAGGQVSRGHTTTEEEVKLIQKHDLIKKNFCKRNGIPLLVIPYTQINSVEKLVREFLAATA